MKKLLSSIILLILVVLFVNADNKNIVKVLAADPVVIVIDPGHGGTGDRNLGAQYNGFSEKEMTLQVANAMKNELEKYDNVEVYMTRTTDTYVSLEDRAAYAESVGADFIYSIHFNASSEHSYYGSEVWTSAFGSYYQAGYNLGQIESSELEKLGLYQKGIKTRIGKTGKDYYGIIRASVARNIPCVIIEHAYLDHEYDLQLLKTKGIINKLGVTDATAVAKYFKLTSKTSGVDYSGYTYKSVKRPVSTVKDDTTPPDYCNINVITFDEASRNALIQMSTKDSQSPVIYFSYSYDGGKTFSYLQMWDRTKETQTFNVNIPSGVTNPSIVCRAYNNYEKCTQSAESNVPNYTK